MNICRNGFIDWIFVGMGLKVHLTRLLTVNYSITMKVCTVWNKRFMPVPDSMYQIFQVLDVLDVPGAVPCTRYFKFLTYCIQIFTVVHLLSTSWLGRRWCNHLLYQPTSVCLTSRELSIELVFSLPCSKLRYRKGFGRIVGWI